MRKAHFIVLAVSLLLLQSCEGVGFHQLDLSTRSKASEQTARDVLLQIQNGLRAFNEAKHHYPQTTDVHLYDSIRNLFTSQMDPVHLYRNDAGKGYYIAVGGRANRIVYRYPATTGTGEYSLYWVGLNAVDEDGDGDDIDAFQVADAAHRFERPKLADLQGTGVLNKLLLSKSGNDIFHDSVTLIILQHTGGRAVTNDSVLFTTTWPLAAYFKSRPELTDVERKRVVRAELDKFFAPGHFVHTDSLLIHDWGQWADVKPKSPEMSEIVKRNEEMFCFYTGAGGSRGIAWSPTRNKFVVIWKS